MMKNVLKKLAAAVAVLSLTAAMAACGTTGSAPSDPVSATASGGPETVAEDGPEEAALYTADVPAADYDGYTFRIDTSHNLGEAPTAITYAAEMTGEIVNDSLYERDRWLEERFNIAAVYNCAADTNINGLKNSVIAGDNAYDLVIRDMATCGRVLGAEGLLYALNEIDGIRLDKPYWFNEINADMFIGDRLYYASSTISPRFYGSVYVTMFNKLLAGNLGVSDLYKLVSDGKWTLDAAAERAKLVVQDLNNDGVIDDQDVNGFCYERLSPEVFMIGFGEQYVRNEGGALTVRLGNPSFMAKAEKLASVLADASFANTCASDYGKPAFDEDTVLEEGRYLFWNPCTFNLDDFRDYDYDYGILPMPKYDEKQDAYYANSQLWVAVSPCITVDSPLDDLPMIGTITDAMCAYGLDFIRPAVYDTVLTVKGVRDEESAAILDDIFGSIVPELSTLFNLNTITQDTRTYFLQKLGEVSLSTIYAADEEKIAAELADVVDAFASFPSVD